MAFVTSAATVEWQPLRLDWRPDGVTAEVRDQRFELSRAADEPLCDTLNRLAQVLAVSGWTLVDCHRCLWYWTTGASRQQSRGAAGYCALVGLRNRRALVTADHACGRWSQIRSTAADVAAQRAEREAALRRGRPDRQDDVVGCFGGLGWVTQGGTRRPGAGDRGAGELQQRAERFGHAVRAVADWAPSWVRAPADDTAALPIVADGHDDPLATLHALALLGGIITWRHGTFALPRLLSAVPTASLLTASGRASSLLLGRWAELTMRKQPLNVIQDALQTALAEEGRAATELWRPLLQAAPEAMIGEQLTVPELATGEGWARAVARAWSCCHEAGSLPAASRALAATCEDPLVEMIVGAISGMFHGKAFLERECEGWGLGGLSDVWVAIGERFFRELPKRL
jgi:hypothetical protein